MHLDKLVVDKHCKNFDDIIPNKYLNNIFIQPPNSQMEMTEILGF